MDGVQLISKIRVCDEGGGGKEREVGGTPYEVLVSKIRLCELRDCWLCVVHR